MRPVTKQLMRNLRNKESRPREVRYREFTIKKWLVYSPNAITRDFRKPNIFDTKEDALWMAGRMRNCGCNVVVERVSETVRLPAFRFHFPAVIHETMRSSNRGLQAIA